MAAWAVLLMIGPALAGGGSARPLLASQAAALGAEGPALFDRESLAALRAAPRVAVPDSTSDGILPGSTPLRTAPGGTLSVVVTLAFSNTSRLASLLRELSDPSSSKVRSYLTGAQFDAEFGGSPATYREAAAFFGSYGVQDLTSYSDRATLSFETTPSEAEQMFDVPIASFETDGRAYIAPTGPVRLPAPLSAAVVQVEGLGTASSTVGRSLEQGTISSGGPSQSAASPVPTVGGYRAPVTEGTAQIEFAPDLQVAYDEQSLLAAHGEPLNTTVALITSSGAYTGAPFSNACGSFATSEDVGPWSPSDLSSYFGHSLPTGQHPAVVTDVPLGSATPPGCAASWDSSGAVAANTVDLEMIGSTAPGARIYGVYGPTPSAANLDTAVATVLNPSSSLGTTVQSGLENVSVIATSWGFSDVNDSAWYGSLEEAAARGITVLAATGNSADDPSSPGWVGSAVEFPASMAFATFGTVAVGGTTVTLDPSTLQITDQVAWNVSATHGGPAGTSGGISALIKEPSWQKSSSAATLLGGKGRGVPDLAGLANDTAATVTIGGFQYQANNASSHGKFYNASGTGVAVGVVAGLFAEIDHALRAAANPAVGFADPTIYPLATQEYDPLPNGAVHGAGYTTPNYTSPLPTLPFRDVVRGRNFADTTGVGYDLVTGWGSLDAYNFTMYLLVPTTFPAYGPLRAVQDYVNLTGLATAPTKYNSNTHLSIQQNLFVANAFGAPIVWVQTVVLFSEQTNGKWVVNYTGWVVYPFFGIYPQESVYEFWIPTIGHLGGLPPSLDLTTFISPEKPNWVSTVTFAFGGLTSPFTLDVPGGEYLLGGFDHSYNWQGTNHTNGPAPDGPVRGFLAPQIGLYGSPAGGPGEFEKPTAGSIAAFVEPLGTTTFVPAETAVIALHANQTGEFAENLSYTPTSPNDWSIAYLANATEQGISVSEPYRYPLTFSETGAPASISWNVQLSNGLRLSGTGAQTALVGNVQNGSYAWTVGIGSKNYSISVSSGNVTITGAPSTIDIVFTAKTNTVTFVGSGPMGFPFDWSVAIASASTLSGTLADLETTLTYAKYTYHVTCTNSSWQANDTKGTFTIGAQPITVEVPFHLVTFKVKTTPVYAVGVLVPWTVTVDGVAKHGHATTAFTWPLPNGSYTFSVSGLPANDHAVPSHGSFVVKGLPAPNILIRIEVGNSGIGLFGLGIWGFALVGAAAAAAVLLLIVLVRRRRGSPGEPSDDRSIEGPADPYEERPVRPKKKPPRQKGSRYVSPDEI
ncbi:MAG: protease pro-enzyme activation domain-containing protein [Thermoplasmata archaeon]